MWYEEGNNGDYFFFIFDEDVMKTEYDILEDAVIYYQPKKVNNTLLVTKISCEETLLWYDISTLHLGI